MNGKRVFVDTNMVIYSYSKSEPLKQQKANTAIINNECVISSQVLNEYANVCIKKLGVSAEYVHQDILNILNNCECYTVDVETIEHALFLQSRYGYSYYDSVILASALDCSCEYLFSEDFQDNQIIENTLTIKNVLA
jgi:predicted nucleic acid-binding protein